MIDIYVQRGAGDKEGDVIVDGLIGNVAIALARGRNELDENAQLMKTTTREIVYRDGIRPGQTALVRDTLGGAWKGQITGITHRYSNGQLTTSLRIKRAA